MSTHNAETNTGLHRAAGLKTDLHREGEIRPLAEMERLYIESVIAYCSGNIPRAALLLKVSPSTIYRKQAVWAKAAG